MDPAARFDATPMRPSLVSTEFTGRMVRNQAVTDDSRRHMPIAPLGTPEDVASVVAFLLADEAGWITGQVIGGDGDHTIRRGPIWCRSSRR